MITENLSTLKIHKLTQEQYDRELAAGNIDENALYLTPDEEVDLSGYATKDNLNSKADKSHKHAISDVTNLQSTIDSTLETAKSYTDTKTSGLASTSVVDNKITAHNTSTTAHSEIRLLITDLTTKLNNFLDVDDTTTDQLSEVITLIENNKGTLESLTTSKINVSDIVNNLTTNSASKVLSAAQGVAIKTLIDALQDELDSIPQSDLGQNDETAADYVKNRTHWTANELTTLVDQTVNCSNGEVTISTPFNINVGQNYTVVFDGTTYECVGFDDGGWRTIGSSYGVYDNYPFCIYNAGGDLSIATKLETSHTLKITGVAEVVYKLDEKYIPDTFLKTEDAVGKSGTADFSEVFNDYNNNIASGYFSHAEGNCTEASGWATHAEGFSTIAASRNQHVEGANNIADTEGKYIHIAGNGSQNNAGGTRSNAHTLDWDGNAWFAGNVTVGADKKQLAVVDSGTWTPVFYNNYNSTVESNITVRTAQYFKIGKICYIWLVANQTTYDNIAPTKIQEFTLPFASLSVGSYISPSNLDLMVDSVGVSDGITCRVANNRVTFGTTLSLPNPGQPLNITGWYIVNDD